jgi:hypothetical protein
MRELVREHLGTEVLERMEEKGVQGMAKDLDTTSPYDEEFREEWREGDPPIRWIKEQFGKPCRMTLGGVSGLYVVTGITDAGNRIVIEGRRKPDHD